MGTLPENLTPCGLRRKTVRYTPNGTEILGGK